MTRDIVPYRAIEVAAAQLRLVMAFPSIRASLLARDDGDEDDILVSDAITGITRLSSVFHTAPTPLPSQVENLIEKFLENS